jgi:hypothetical protein
VDVSLTRWPYFTHQKGFLAINSVKGWVNPRATVQLEVWVNWKYSMTSSGIELMTFQLVAQCLKQIFKPSSYCSTSVGLTLDSDILVSCL